MEEITCENCGGTRFREYGSVATMTDVILSYENGRPTFVDYDDIGSEPIWDYSVGYRIECGSCCTPLKVEGYDETTPPEEAGKDA